MKTTVLGLLLLLTVGFGLAFQIEVERGPADPAQTAPATLADTLLVPEGLEVTLWAESPMIYNPTNMDVDAEGRVWVLETLDYRNFRNDPEEHKSAPAGERVVILEDTDGDGHADASTVFVEDEDLVSPLGLAVIGNKVYVSASPTIYVYTDTDGDDKADEREVFLTGFGGMDHDHGLHGIIGGPDGRFYFNAGNAGPHIVTDKAGWTLRAGSIYSGGSPYMEDNQPNLVSDDGRVWVGGVQLRVEPDGTGLEVLVDNYRNSYELAVDSYGNVWNNDNDDDGNAGTRVLWSMEGGDTGYFSQDGSRTWRADRRPWQEDVFKAHWHQDDPGVIPAGDSTGPGAPTGIVFYEGDALGEAYRGTLLSADAGRNVIFAYQPEPQGAGFELDREYFFSTPPEDVLRQQSTYKAGQVEDTRYFFRPSDVTVGTDGAIYVADWYDPRVGGHQMLEKEGYGRIFRIAPQGRTLETPTLELSTTAGQIEALQNPAINVRYQAFQQLADQGAAVIDEVKPLLEADNPYHQARAVWLLAQLGSEGVQTVEGLLDASDPALQVTAFRALRQMQDQDQLLAHARQLADDPSPAVRREVAIFLRDVPLAQSRDLMLDLARGYESGDRWMLEAYGLAADGEEDAVYDLLQSELGGDDPAAWSPAWADLVWRLHPVAAIDALQARASAASLSMEQRDAALTALGFMHDRAALAAMETLAESSDAEVAERAQWWIDYRRTNEWYDLKDWAAESRTPEEQEALDQVRTLEQTMVDDATPAQERVAAAQKMAASAPGGRLLLRHLAEETLPADVSSALRDSLVENPDRTVRVLTQHYLPDADAEAVATATEVAGMEGDPTRGQMVFYTKCAVCHRVGETGGDVGPALTGVKNMFDGEGLSDAVLHPNAGITHGYSPQMIGTDDGEVFFGFLLAENPSTIVMKDADGQQHVINRDRIVSQQSLEVSLMPGPQELELTPQDVADVVTFLMNVPEE